jgi:hypothetical protein
MQLSDGIVPNGKVVIVGCFNGGSDLESFVVVLGMRPGLNLPQVLLDADCGDTEWQVRGSALVIKSWDLYSGASSPSPAHPDVSFTWQGGTFGLLLPTSAAYGSNGTDWPTFCKTLDIANN